MHNAIINMMANTPKKLINYFQKLGFKEEIADLYFALNSCGPTTISGLATYSGVERTKIYRLLDQMTDSGIFEVVVEHKRKLLQAVDVKGLEIIFAKKEQELHDLQQQLPSIEQLLLGRAPKNKGTKILFYRGEEGAKQMLWNETRAKGEVLSILYENIQVKTAEKFFERWVNKCNSNNNKFRSVVSDKFLASQENWYRDHANEQLNNWDSRYIDSSLFDITHSTLLYDDVVAYYSWQDHEIFGIEIHNQDIASSQREFFEMLWERAAKN